MLAQNGGRTETKLSTSGLLILLTSREGSPNSSSLNISPRYSVFCLDVRSIERIYTLPLKKRT